MVEVSDGKGVEFYREAVAELGLPSGKTTKWRIKDWNPTHTKILVMVQRGMTAAQIATAAEVSYTIKEIKRIIDDPLFRLKLSQYNKKMDTAIIERATEELTKFPEVELARGQLASSAEKAARVLTNLIDPRSKISKLGLNEKRLLLSAAQDILNRVGLKDVGKGEEKTHGREYSPDEIKSALENARELEQISSRLNGQDSAFVLNKRTGNGSSDAFEGSAGTEISSFIETSETTATDDRQATDMEESDALDLPEPTPEKTVDETA